jgi:hypothetical protein
VHDEGKLHRFEEHVGMLMTARYHSFVALPHCRANDVLEYSLRAGVVRKSCAITS